MKTGSEAIRALAMQIPAFRQKLSDGWYQVRIAGRDAGETELSARLNEPLENGAVIHIVPRLAGAKSGGVFQAVLGAFRTLIANGATVVVIEHDLDVIRSADYIIDMGPGGGEEGGRIVAAGTPAQIKATPESRTGHYI